MQKVNKEPGAFLMPLPAVLVSSRDSGGKDNLITIAWAGMVCSEPPILSVSIRPSRHSYGIIKKAGEFGVNIPSKALVKKVDFCGVKSGRDTDKFKECGFTPFKAEKIAVSLVNECPVNLECKVVNSILLGTHEVFLAEILKVWVNSDVLDKNNRLDVLKAELYSYCDTRYVSLGEIIGYYGYSQKV